MSDTPHFWLLCVRWFAWHHSPGCIWIIRPPQRPLKFHQQWVGGGAELRCFTTLGSKSWCEVAASGDAVLLDAEIRRHRHPEPHNPAVLCGGAVTGVTVPVLNLKVFIRLLPGWIHCTNWNHASFISRWREVSAVMACELLILNLKCTVLPLIPLTPLCKLCRWLFH